MTASKIITVGLTPVWDRICCVDGIEWGDHKQMAASTLVPAGKALNISRALAWLSVSSTAAGLWGRADYPDMIEALSGCRDFIHTALTVVPGRTRQNITVVDTRNNREMHLRSTETLITPRALETLKHDLSMQIDPRVAVIFAGSIPEGPLQDDCITLIAQTAHRCGTLIVDTSGSALNKLVDQGCVSVIKPNLDELSELLGRRVDKDLKAVTEAARSLCDRVHTILVSLGRDGAVAVTKEETVACKVKTHRRTVHTVGCGDYLLAGFVSSGPSADLSQKLKTGVQTAAARAWGLAGSTPWAQVQEMIDVI